MFFSQKCSGGRGHLVQRRGSTGQFFFKCTFPPEDIYNKMLPLGIHLFVVTCIFLFQNHAKSNNSSHNIQTSGQCDQNCPRDISLSASCMLEQHVLQKQRDAGNTFNFCFTNTVFTGSPSVHAMNDGKTDQNLPFSF
jgi:hypothetical protein